MPTENNKNIASRTLLLPILATGVLLFTLVSSIMHSDGPACISRMIFHTPCPGCGMTRSLQSIWHGNFTLAFRYHPLGPPLFLLCLAVVCHSILSSRSSTVYQAGRAFGKLAARRSTQLALLFLFVGLWVIRTILAQRGDTIFVW